MDNTTKFCWVILIVSLIVYPLIIFTHDSEKPQSGEVLISKDISEYGFGPEKKLLIFDISEIGKVENIDLSDKKFAKLTWSSTKGTNQNTIGIEIKGAGLDRRKKLNLAFEIWSEKTSGVPCTSIETCEDDKKELFDFGEKYEDYVLRGGWFDQTFIRDYIPSDLEGGILQKDLVEVIFKFDDKYTYEGVYILYPAIQRRVLEKRLNWNSKGKAEDCDDPDYDIDKVSLIIEHTIESLGRKHPDELFKEYSIKMRYPKDSFYDEEAIKPCRDAYLKRTNHFASVLNLKNTSEVKINLDSFANNYLVEMLMRDDDFPFTSQYFYVNPDNSQLYAGPRWDYDSMYYRKLDKKGWNLINAYGYYFQDVIQLWRKLGKNKEFIDLVKTKKTILENNKNIIKNTISQRRKQFKDGLFDRELERWDMYNKKRSSNGLWLLGQNAYSKKTPEKEIDFIEKKLIERSDWMIENVKSFDGYDVEEHLLLYIWILYISPLWLSCFVLCCLSFKKKNPYKQVSQV